jgi:hypothetical protein
MFVGARRHWILAREDQGSFCLKLLEQVTALLSLSSQYVRITIPALED